MAIDMATPEGTEIALVVSKNGKAQIPEYYLNNAMPYYVMVDIIHGDTLENVVCYETVGQLGATYEHGREIKLKILDANTGRTLIANMVSVFTNEYGYCFNFFSFDTTATQLITLTAQEDGFYDLSAAT